MIDATDDEGVRYLDLAAFADGSLDPDEHERVAEWLARHPDMAEDVAAARAFASTGPLAAPPKAIVARACAILEVTQTDPGPVVRLRPKPRTSPVFHDLAQWGGLAAALVIAGWLGFTLGMDASGRFAQNGRAADDGLLQELLGPPPGSIRDLTGGA